MATQVPSLENDLFSILHVSHKYYSLTVLQCCLSHFHIQWCLLIRTPFESNTSQSEHILRTNFDLQSECALSIRTQKHVAADATFPPVLLTRLRREHLSLLGLGNGFQVTPALVASVTLAPNPGLFLSTTPVNAAFYYGHSQIYLLMKIYLIL